MNASGPKYSWVKDDADQYVALTYADLLAHASGRATIGAQLHDNAGLCRIGMLDIDAGGRAAVVAALAAAHFLGYTAYGLSAPAGAHLGAEHDGGRLVVEFTAFAPWRDVRAVMEQIRAAAQLPEDTELWPGGGNAVALPFGEHLRKKKRDELLTQAGEMVNLDTDLKGGFDLVTSLPRNSAPPAVMVVQTSDKSDYYAMSKPLAQANHVPDARPGRASLDDVKARFNADNPLDQLLLHYGAVQTSQKDFSCPFCEHSHTNTLYIYNGRVHSRAPVCTIPQKRGLDSFGLYTLVEHHDNVIAALKALNPIAPRKTSTIVEPARSTDAQRTNAQEADAARKRAARRAQAAETVEQVTRRASQDGELSDRGQLVLLALLEVAGDRDWCRPSVARLMDMTDLSERSIYYGLAELVERGYMVSQAQRGGTTRRTFIRVHTSQSESAPIAPELDHDHDLISDQIGACEGAAIAPPEQPGQRALVETLGAMDDAAFRAWYAGHAPATSADLALDQAAPAGDDPPLDMAEIARMVADIQAAADALQRPVHDEPRHYWERHEALLWRETHPVAARAPEVYAKRVADDEAERARIRASWDALGDNPRALGARLGKLRNRLRNYPQSRRALAWQISELHDRLAALTPLVEAVEPMRRRRGSALSSDSPQIAAPAQLVFELAPCSNQAPPFARALVEGSGALTSSTAPP